jgi:hypothetical protein
LCVLRPTSRRAADFQALREEHFLRYGEVRTGPGKAFVHLAPDHPTRKLDAQKRRLAYVSLIDVPLLDSALHCAFGPSLVVRPLETVGCLCPHAFRPMLVGRLEKAQRRGPFYLALHVLLAR